MTGLRAKQKAERRRLIEESATKFFETKGFELTTIEEIAEGALVSAATVYNYYGTKGELLLALIARGEEGTKARVDEFVDRAHSDLPAALISDIICSNMKDTLNFLSRELWGHAVAYVATTKNPEVAPRYLATIADDLALALEKAIEQYIQLGKLADVDANHLAYILTRLERNHFLEHIYLKESSQQEMLAAIRKDVSLLINAISVSLKEQ